MILEIRWRHIRPHVNREALMDRIKRLLNNDKIKILLISALIAAVMQLIHHAPGLLRNLSDWLFLTGLLHILVGAVRYIKNVGLFKTFSYMSYKRRWKKHVHSGESRPMSLAEYTVNVILNDANQRPVAWPLGAGLLLCAASFLTAMVIT